MLHKQAAHSIRNTLSSRGSTEIHEIVRPRLVGPGESRPVPSALPELVTIASRRCSSFLAEAAVLVLVFGLLDFFLQRGRIELAWGVGALLISVGLLAASVATDFGARRWLGAHP